MSKGEIRDLLKKTNALKYGEFELSSGKKSDYYIDIKKASTSPSFLKLIGKEISKEIDTGDKLAGVALGGIPLVVAASIYSKKPYLMIRKKRKDYGTQERIEGDYSTNDEIIVIEDVTTTGNSLLEAIEVLREKEVKIKKAIVVVDREEGAKELMEKNKINFVPILTASYLLEGGK